MRLDQYLVEQGLAKSRSFAKVLITEGYVTVDGKMLCKPATEVASGAAVAVTGTPYTYVSRGGVKLEAALRVFGIDPTGLCAVDIGASSGGFTDCLLQHGAARVYAVDSGSEQLDLSLLQDPRVISMEQCNARTLTPADIGEICDLCVMDVSFISQRLILPVIPALLSETGILISLIKPQFECGREGLSKNGIVKDGRVRQKAVQEVLSCAIALGLAPVGLTVSPVTGGDGNVEFLLCCRKNAAQAIDDKRISEVCGQ